jgi:hypothetical protein
MGCLVAATTSHLLAQQHAPTAQPKFHALDNEEIDFSGWEEKERYINFPLVKVEKQAVHFDGLSFFRSGDELKIYLLLEDRKTGAVREEQFTMKRQ